MSAKYQPNTRVRLTLSVDPAAQRLFILEYGSRRVLVAPPLGYDDLQRSIRRHFPEIPSCHRISYHTRDLQISEGSFVEVSSDVWGAVIPMLRKLTVQSEDPAEPSRPATPGITGPSISTPISLIPSTSHSFSIIVLGQTGRRIQLQVFPTHTISDIKAMVQDSEGIPPDQQRLIWGGRQLVDGWTVGAVGITNDSVIHLVLRLTGGKPVIYLLPPSGTNVEATVKLSLVPEWKFDAVYPAVPTTSSSTGGQTLQWNLKASPDGTLLEKNTGLEVSYLFWEAEALKAHEEPLSPLPSPTDEQTGFDLEPAFIPSQPHIDPTNSVVLEVPKMTPYLDTTLKTLGLHTEARTSFISYWLPAFLKHPYVSLRFLPQAAYEIAAPLEVSPVPDVTVRIFMLFKGLKEEDVQGKWGTGLGASAVDWRSIVGLGEQSLLDDTLFRVVEWGGMEIL